MPRAGRFAAPLDGSDTEDQSGAYRRGEPWGPDAIRLFNVRQRELTPETADATGQMLWAENVRSVNHRYDEDEWEEVYVYRPVRAILSLHRRRRSRS